MTMALFGYSSQDFVSKTVSESIESFDLDASSVDGFEVITRLHGLIFRWSVEMLWPRQKVAWFFWHLTRNNP